MIFNILVSEVLLKNKYIVKDNARLTEKLKRIIAYSQEITAKKKIPSPHNCRFFTFSISRFLIFEASLW